MKTVKKLQTTLLMALIAIFLLTPAAFGLDGMMIDEAGNVGIGTDSPNEKLHIHGGNLAFTDNNAKISFSKSDGGWTTEMGLEISGDNRLYFKAPGSTNEDLVIHKSGRIGIGTSTPEAKLHIAGDSNTLPLISTDYWGIFQEKYVGGEGQKLTLDYTTTTTAGSFNVAYHGTKKFIFDVWRGRLGIGKSPSYELDVNGTIRSSNGVCQGSDRRLKTSIATCTSALDKVSRLRGVTFEWKDKNKEPGQQLGVIAQEVEKVYPEVVKTDSQDGYKSVAYSKLVAPLIEAVKELKAENDDLKKEIAHIKKKLAANSDILR